VSSRECNDSGPHGNTPHLLQLLEVKGPSQQGTIQEKELRFRPRSWRVNAGAESLRSNDTLYPSFRPAEQA
jgi:hypothetical protein